MFNKILNISLIFFFLFFAFNSLNASEIRGRISTKINKSWEKNLGDKFRENKKKIKVLGISRYGDGVLLRSKDKKIYVIYGKFKNYISSLDRLKRYRGQAIYDVSDKDLEKYKTRKYIDGDLIRMKGDNKIFLIQKGKLKHILNLEELRRNFRGEEIFNLSREELILYR